MTDIRWCVRITLVVQLRAENKPDNSVARRSRKLDALLSPAPLTFVVTGVQAARFFFILDRLLVKSKSIISKNEDVTFASSGHANKVSHKIAVNEDSTVHILNLSKFHQRSTFVTS